MTAKEANAIKVKALLLGAGEAVAVLAAALIASTAGELVGLIASSSIGPLSLGVLFGWIAARLILLK